MTDHEEQNLSPEIKVNTKKNDLSLHDQTETKIKVEDEDEGDVSEDSGIVESDADRTSQEKTSKAKCALNKTVAVEQRSEETR